MKHSEIDKNVSIGGRVVITDWRDVKVVAPENLQERIKANETARHEVEKQKEVAPTSSNSFIGLS